MHFIDPARRSIVSMARLVIHVYLSIIRTIDPPVAR
jgi:hypothetical protein